MFLNQLIVSILLKLVLILENEFIALQQCIPNQKSIQNKQTEINGLPYKTKPAFKTKSYQSLPSKKIVSIQITNDTLTEESFKKYEKLGVYSKNNEFTSQSDLP